MPSIYFVALTVSDRDMNKTGVGIEFILAGCAILIIWLCESPTAPGSGSIIPVVGRDEVSRVLDIPVLIDKGYPVTDPELAPHPPPLKISGNTIVAYSIHGDDGF
jgi:hypothetical protein